MSDETTARVNEPQLRVVNNERAVDDVLDALCDLLPSNPGKSEHRRIVRLLRDIAEYEPYEPKQGWSWETDGVCDWCGGPRKYWVLASEHGKAIWCWFVPKRHWRDDICASCFADIPGARKWLERNTPELVPSITGSPESEPVTPVNNTRKRVKPFPYRWETPRPEPSAIPHHIYVGESSPTIYGSVTRSEGKR